MLKCRKSTKGLQEFCEFLSHTGWVYKCPRLVLQIILSQGLLGYTCFAGGLEKTATGVCGYFSSSAVYKDNCTDRKITALI